MVDSALGCFHPVSRRWFSAVFGGPTPAQAAAWPLIAAGRHVLVTAPTGSGKTLTAFFHALDSLLTGAVTPGAVRVLYISPLKALNNDIRRNLLSPLSGLAAAFREAGHSPPAVRVMTRSGDTPESERREMVTRPPEILITTPESLTILLTSKRGAEALGAVETVILDEIHAVAGSKRGAYLMTAVERLTSLSGEFQRIALSATVEPLDRVAELIGGYRRGVQREVSVVSPPMEKPLSVAVRYAAPLLHDHDASSPENPSWRGAAAAMAGRIAQNTTTLIFANSRRGVERLSRLVGEQGGGDTVYAHHGSLSKEIRLLVEERLKAGVLKGVVATSSLELGIDVGHIDEVLMLETPFSVAAALQRIGRSGHRVGETSRGTIFVLYPQDAIDAAITAREVHLRRVAPIASPKAPLDVLAQAILSICAHQSWSLDALYAHLVDATPYHGLPRRLFDLVVEMLAGRYQGVHVPTLRPRLAIDRVEGAARTLPPAVRLLYRSGGTIPDRGYFSVRIKETGALIGELDEEFVWERKIGDVINLGVQAWRIVETTYNDVLVTHYKRGRAETPFWRCEERASDAHFADLRAAFLETADAQLADGSLETTLQTAHFLDTAAAELVVGFLSAQKRSLGVSLPHRRHLVVERVAPASGSKMGVTVIHNEWGGKVNRPFGIALRTALTKALDQPVQVVHGDGGVAVAVENALDPRRMLTSVTADTVESLVREGVEETGLFGAAFRENAARALLILRAGFGRRTPLWLNRKRAKEIRERTAALEDFPINLETFRTVLQDESDLAALVEKLDALEAGIISVSTVDSDRPSPFAEPLVHKVTNALMYEDDALSDAGSNTNAALIDAVLFDDGLRPRFAPDVIGSVSSKLSRTHPGYAPGSPLELISWLEERRLLPLAEWERLVAAVARDGDRTPADLLADIAHRAVLVRPVAAEGRNGAPFVAAVTEVPGLCRLCRLEAPELRSIAEPNREAPEEATAAISAMETTSKGGRSEAFLAAFLDGWLRYFGPLPVLALPDMVPVSRRRLDDALHLLKQDKRVVIDALSERGSEGLEVCHVETLRLLLRASRAGARHSLAPQPLSRLPAFMAEHQGLTSRAESRALEAVLEPLFGFAALPAAFEQEILPARKADYRPAELDALLGTSNLQWVATEKRAVFFALAEDRLLFDQRLVSARTVAAIREIFPDSEGRYTVSDLEKRTGLPGSVLSAKLSALVSRGVVTAATFDPVREGAPRPAPVRAVRPRFSKWRQAEADMRVFYPLPPRSEFGDAIDEADLARERARVLLDRYGILFRALLERESLPLQWSGMFKTLRLMELAGEVVGGYFFDGIPGIQFLSHAALARLQQPPKERADIFWLNAKDPASLAGLRLPGLDLPPRAATTHLVYRGNALIIVSKRGGKYLDIRIPPTDPDLEEALGFIEVMLTREVAPLPVLTVEKINGRPAGPNPYREAFRRRFDTSASHRTLTVARRYGR